MCGRYVSATTPDAIASYFGALVTAETALPASWNVAPTNDVYGVVERPDGSRSVEVFHWGLVPMWAKDIKLGQKMINARAETLAAKGAFRSAFAKRRCLVPMDGFYEWKAVPGHKVKQPYFIHRLDGEPLAVAGLWERWNDPDGGVLHSVSVITTTANATMAPVHDRMPVLLSPASWAEWLDPSGHDLVRLGELLVPAPDTLLTMHPVSTAVGNVRSKGPELIEPVEVVTQEGLPLR